MRIPSKGASNAPEPAASSGLGRPLLVVGLLLAIALVAVGARGQPLRNAPDPAGPTSTIELSFGGVGRVADGVTSLGFFVSLGGRLDIVVDRARPRASTDLRQAPPIDDDARPVFGQDDDDGAKRAPKKSTAPEPPSPEPEPEPASAPAHDAPASAPRTIDGTLARGVVHAAIALYRDGGASDRLDSLTTRSRASALLPEIRVRIGHDVDEGATVSPTEYDPSRVTSSGGSSLWVEGRATFRLDRLVFADEEVQIERLRVEREKEERLLTDRILGLIERFQAAEWTMADPGLVDPDVRAKAEVARIASAAALDVLSGGWFSAHLEAR